MIIGQPEVRVQKGFPLTTAYSWRQANIAGVHQAVIHGTREEINDDRAQRLLF